MIEHVYPSDFKEISRKKVRPEYIEKADIDVDGNLSYEVFHLSCGDSLKVHFKPDGTIICFSGGGSYVTIKRNGEEVTEYYFADLDRWSVREDIRHFFTID